ncbi:HAMP domain-containing methyl-accepting chemotaxis protein [Halalkalirubrum salinum]|uniref:HAMP domain-containing methyl-accepting chemotaxis protein n=1 Tax=Halalkalirubrum salinum TaxID=2563889 RepID=UPI0010FAFEEC|nr:methyl-accepting chemotaxis protein [Halalkalirubrum salinum]
MLEKIAIDRLDLRPKLLIAFVLVALLVGVTGAVGYQAVADVDKEAHVISGDGDKIDASLNMLVAIEEQQVAVHAALLGEEGERTEFEAAGERFDEYSAALQQQELTDQEQDEFQALQAQHEEYSAIAQELFAAIEAGDMDQAQAKSDELDQIVADTKESATTLEKAAVEDKEASVATADDTTQTAQQTIIGLTVGAFITAILIGLFVAGRISPPLTQLSNGLTAISNGELDTKVDPHIENDEIGRMVDAYIKMQDNLKGVFSQIGTASEGLKQGELDWEFEAEYPGRYGETIANLETGANELAGSFEAIQHVSGNLEQGVLDNDVNTDRPGQYGAVLDNLAIGTTQLSNSFEQISAASDGLKQGQLAQNIDTDYPGAYGDVLANLEDGIGRLGDSIGSVKDIADRVATSSDVVAQNTEEVKQASEKVAESVEEISYGADTQSENLQEVANETNDMSATVEEIASSADQVAATAGIAVEQGNEGREYAAEATAEIQSIETQANEAAAQVTALEKDMNEIGEIVEMISGIAEKTNILALNASIEAARAGEAGQGFGVVASEVKSLAEEAAKATAAVEDRIETAQASTTETVEGMEQMSDRVERGSDTIESAIEMFDEIADAVQEAESGIREISDATDDQAASTEEVVSVVDEVASVSEQTAAESSNVSAATEEQTASLAETSETIQELSTLAGDLNEQVTMFETQTNTAAQPNSQSQVAADGGSVASDSDPAGYTR